MRSPDQAESRERYTEYLDMVMAGSKEQIRAELDRLMTKIMDAQRLSTPGSPIGRILFR